jgi:uncharacterized membrane protein (UPF0127 family)
MTRERGVPTCLFLPPPGGPLRLRVDVADRFLPRLIGLLRHPTPPAAGTGLLLIARGGVHTVGMRYPIDILQLDADLTVLRALHGVAPRRVIAAPAGTRATLEVAGGSLPPGLTAQRFYCNKDYP